MKLPVNGVPDDPEVDPAIPLLRGLAMPVLAAAATQAN